MRFQFNKKVVLWVLIGLSFIVAFWFGTRLATSDEQVLIKNKFPEYELSKTGLNNNLYTLVGSKDTLYLKTAESIGYGGKMLVGTVSDSEGTIHSVELLYDIETVAYIRKMVKHSFFSQFNGKTVDEGLTIGHDIAAVSGATISSIAIANATKSNSHFMAKNLFGKKPAEIDTTFSIATYEFGVFAFFLLSMALTFWLKKRIYKTITYLLSIVFLGFLWNMSFSVSFFSRLLLGEIPSLTEGLLFWLFMLFFIGGIIVYKKNLYCSSICPFFGVQYFFSKLSGTKWSLHPRFKKHSMQVNGFLLWLVLIIALLKSNTTMSSYEPFSMMFSLQGNGVQWFIFPVMIIGSMFVSQFFCKYFCPIGALSFYSLKARKGDLFKEKRRSSTSRSKKMSSKTMAVQHYITSGLYVLSLFAILYYLTGVLWSGL